ncbi:MAG: class I fructose-bisphosphate aldolase [Rhodobacteraceae bacterium]|nr:class I fructose-bisphosphate aldolase [Paracoccaceae bacterium]
MSQDTRSQQFDRIKSAPGFIAALDQSGGSTPKALKLYGVEENEYSGDGEMFDLIHQMRSRIMTSSAFNGDRVLGAILFEMTMDREVEGTPAADYLWNTCGVVPFLKVDKGLADPENANDAGIAAVVDQQFDIGIQILGHGLIPIIEPEVTISITDKAEAEQILHDHILRRLNTLSDDQNIMLKLTLPEVSNLYADLADHSRVLRVVALSGGYAMDEANARLSKNRDVIASFSRALTEKLNAKQSDAEFDRALDGAIESIYQASIAN